MTQKQLYPYGTRKGRFGTKIGKSLQDYFLNGFFQYSGIWPKRSLRKKLLGASALTPNSPYEQQLKESYRQKNSLDATALHYFRAGVAVAKKTMNHRQDNQTELEPIKETSLLDESYPEFRQQVTLARYSLPVHVEALLALGGVKLNFGRRLADSFPSMADKEARGYGKANNKMTFAPAYFSPLTREIHLWQQHQTRFLDDNPYIYARGPYSSFLHECGHALSATIEDISLDSCPVFLKAYKEDLAALDKIKLNATPRKKLTLAFRLADSGDVVTKDWQKPDLGTPKGRRSHYSYYLPRSEGGAQSSLAAAASEAFAETFKAIRLCENPDTSILGCFKNSAAIMEKINDTLEQEMRQPVALNQFIAPALL